MNTTIKSVASACFARRNPILVPFRYLPEGATPGETTAAWLLAAGIAANLLSSRRSAAGILLDEASSMIEDWKQQCRVIRSLPSGERVVRLLGTARRQAHDRGGRIGSCLRVGAERLCSADGERESTLWALAHPEIVNAVEAAAAFAAAVRGVEVDPADIEPLGEAPTDTALRERWAAQCVVLRELWAAFAGAVKAVRDAGEFLVQERPQPPEAPAAPETLTSPPEGWLD